MRKGYHYTSLANWTQIKVFGLIPYQIEKEELLPYFPGGVVGVWVWDSSPKGLSHAGTIIYQAAFKGTTNVVKLEVSFDESDMLHYGSQPVVLNHKGHLEKLIYHKSQQGRIVLKEIPPENIKLVKSYNLTKLLA